MISSVSFHEIAGLELNEAAKYYESKVNGLGLAFLSKVEHITRQSENNPESAPRILKAVRRKLLRGFPYSVMYSIFGSLPPRNGGSRKKRSTNHAEGVMAPLALTDKRNQPSTALARAKTN